MRAELAWSNCSSRRRVGGVPITPGATHQAGGSACSSFPSFPTDCFTDSVPIAAASSAIAVDGVVDSLSGTGFELSCLSPGCGSVEFSGPTETPKKNLCQLSTS
jgi:hypothetical protein